MSVITTSDEKRQVAKEKITEAVSILNITLSNLRDATNDDTWGADQYSEEFYNFINKSQLEIFEMTIKLKNISKEIW